MLADQEVRDWGGMLMPPINARIRAVLLLTIFPITQAFASGTPSAEEAAVEAYWQQSQAAEAEGATAIARGLVSGKLVCFPDPVASTEPTVTASTNPSPASATIAPAAQTNSAMGVTDPVPTTGAQDPPEAPPPTPWDTSSGDGGSF